MTFGPGIEPEEPTHILSVEVPLALRLGPLDAIVVRDALSIVLSLARCSGAICAEPQATLREVDTAQNAPGSK